jgi:hypothetical protein
VAPVDNLVSSQLRLVTSTFVTKRTVLLLALAATTGVPVLAACGAAERQAPLPPSAAGPNTIAESPQGSVSGASGARGYAPQTADGAAAPTSATVGANVTPTPSDTTGGLLTRPGYVPGVAGDLSLPAGNYRAGARAPWGILLNDRPQPAPAPAPVTHGPGNGGDQGNLPKPGPDHGSGSGSGVTILADPAKTPAAPDVAKSAEPDLPAAPATATATATATDHSPAGATQPAGISFASLLAQLPPMPEPDATHSPQPPDGPRPGHHHHTATSPESAPPTPEPTLLPTAGPQLPAPTATPSPTPRPLTTPSPTPTPTHPPVLNLPRAVGWHLDGLALSNAAPKPSGKGGSAAFRKALHASRQARPDGARPSAGALRRWSASLRKAAALAPDGGTKRELSTLARYAAQLAGTPAPARAGLQPQQPGAIAAASDLRATLPRRFGVNLLG